MVKRGDISNSDNTSYSIEDNPSEVFPEIIS
jgi:hypothetical protein